MKEDWQAKDGFCSTRREFAAAIGNSSQPIPELAVMFLLRKRLIEKLC